MSVRSVSAVWLNGARCTLREDRRPLTDSTCINHPIPSTINHQVDLWTCTYALRGAASASPTCPMRSVAAPRLNTSPFVVGVEHDDPAVVGSEKSETHGAHDAGSNLGICRYRTRSHESAAPPHVTSTRGCNGTDTSTLRIIAPTSPPARLISARSRRPTTTRRRRCASISSAPSAPASRRSSR